MLLGIPLLLTSLVFMIRLVMIMVGLHKGPVLEAFEKYGDEEPFFFPWSQLVFWFGLVVFAAGFIVQEDTQGFNAFSVIGVLLMLVAYWIYTSKDRIQQWLHYIPIIPLWLGRLCENTTRYERRRIAYMWLRLPLRTRLLYSASDRFFFQWADLVIMATVRES